MGREPYLCVQVFAGAVMVSLARRKLQAAERKLTRPCQSPKCLCHSLHRGCGAASVALWARAPGAAGLSVPRRRTGGRCPCDPFLAVYRVSAASGGERNRAGATYLVARVHVEPSPEAMIPAAIFHVVAVLSGHGQSVVGEKHRLAVWQGSLAPRPVQGALPPGNWGGLHGAGRRRYTHPFDVIVIIGANGGR